MVELRIWIMALRKQVLFKFIKPYDPDSLLSGSINDLFLDATPVSTIGLDNGLLSEGTLVSDIGWDVDMFFDTDLV